MLLLYCLAASRGEAQLVQQTAEVVTVPRGGSQIVRHPATLERVSIADPEIADAVPVSPHEVVVNGVQAGTTSLLLWGVGGSSAAYSVRVVANAPYVEDELARLLPGANIRATAAGNTVILSGTVRDMSVAERALALATTLANGSEVVDHIVVPDRPQILLQVRFAEVSRSAVKEIGASLLRVDPLAPRGDDEGALGTGGPGSFGGELLDFQDIGPEFAFSDLVNFFLFDKSSNVSLFLRALRQEGDFRSLAEPNLLAYPGEEASFLAGGEFPYPVLQGATQAVTIEFKEFGIRLNFHPEITGSGAIRMRVAPEVSQLDFSSGIQVSGFQVPALLTRRAETVVELQEGQTFAIAGLIDSSTSRSASKIPWLGEIPILGALFRSKDHRDNRTELLVLVTPQLVHPQSVAPALPTGEPSEWQWDRYMRKVMPQHSPPAP